MKQGLVVIDMQNAVFTLPKPMHQQQMLIKSVAKAIRFARDHGITVIYSLHENNTFLAKGTAGYDLVKPLSIEKNDVVVEKSHLDIFEGSNLDIILKARNINSLIVAGVISNGCVRAACLSALKKGYQVTLTADGHSTFYANAEKVIRSVNRDMELAGVSVIPVDML